MVSVPKPQSTLGLAIPPPQHTVVRMASNTSWDSGRFFESLRQSMFPFLQQSQVDGLNLLLAGTIDFEPRWRAYMLATVFHETGATMCPVEEIGKGAGHPYGLTKYWGRGFVQITWEANYARLGKACNLQLVAWPDLALQGPVALRIMTVGMVQGLFTGRALRDYFSGERDDPVGARRIINGTDKALQIASYYVKFLSALGY